MFFQDVDSEDYWEKLALESDPSRQQKEPLNYNTIIPHLKSKILAFKTQVRRYKCTTQHELILHRNNFAFSLFFLFGQLTGGVVKEAWRIHQPLKVLRNLILTSDLEKSDSICRELGLPHVLFDLVHDTVENTNFIQVIAQEQNHIQQCIIPATALADFFCTFLSNHGVCQHLEKLYLCS